MEIPKNILIIPAVEKAPSKSKTKYLKLAAAMMSVGTLITFLVYFPAPAKFSFTHTFPIATMCILVFLASFSVSVTALSYKKALLVATLVTAILAIKKSPIITIIAYAICIPLLFVKPLQEKPH